jgi:hypothetical protein
VMSKVLAEPLEERMSHLAFGRLRYLTSARRLGRNFCCY